MTVAITVRNVPDEIRDELAARAARSGRSLQEYLLGQLADLATRPTVEDIIARARARARSMGTTLDPSQIVDARDADRR
jgi:antitoxin FitA